MPDPMYRQIAEDLRQMIEPEGLGYEQEGSSGVSRHQQRYIDDTPWSLQTSFYPTDLASGKRQPMAKQKQLIRG